MFPPTAKGRSPSGTWSLPQNKSLARRLLPGLFYREDESFCKRIPFSRCPHRKVLAASPSFASAARKLRRLCRPYFSRLALRQWSPASLFMDGLCLTAHRSTMAWPYCFVPLPAIPGRTVPSYTAMAALRWFSSCWGPLARSQACALRSQESLQSVLFCTEKWIYPKPKP